MADHSIRIIRASLLTGARAARGTVVIIDVLRACRIAGEDEACAEYLMRCLQGEQPNPAEYVDRARAAMIADVEQRLNAGTFPWADIDACAALDRFDFVIRVSREDGLLVARQYHVE